MIDNARITNDLERLGRFREVTETYKILAATNSRRIRGSVLTNRDFHQSLNSIFIELIAAYYKETEKLRAQERKKLTLSQFARHDKTVCMLLSANTGLYGDILPRTLNAFIDEAQIGTADLIIVGKRGKFSFEEVLPGRAYTYYEFSDNRIAYEDMQPIVKQLARYEHIRIFHGQFENRLIQDVHISEISAKIPLAPAAEKSAQPKTETRYFFEPSFTQILSFFQTEIFASLVEQIFHESQLSKLVSRMVLLDRTSSRIDEELTKTTLLKRRIHHRIMNKKQLDAMSGMSLWDQRIA